MRDSRIDWPDQSDFRPRTEFKVTDGDAFMLFLFANSIIFTEPSDDPWFSAHKTWSFDAGDYNVTGYSADYLGTVVGCVEQV